MTMYGKTEIDAVLEKALRELGSERFCSMRLMAREKHIRDTYDPNNILPRKTTLRAAINGFRFRKFGIEPRRLKASW